MPKTSTAINPHGIPIVFTEEDHSYITKINYTSVTTLVGMFFPKFDSEKIAPLSAHKHGKTTEEILEEWKTAGEEACALGTKIHETCEDVLLGNSFRNTSNNENEERMMNVAKIAAKKIKTEFDILGVEKLIFNEQLGIAGTIDLLAKSKKSGKVYIFDWKTNKRILKENDFGTKGLGPITHLDDCNYNHYALQLSIYQYILLETGYVSRDTLFDRALLHLTEYEPRSILVPYFENETKNIIDIYLKERYKNG